MRCEFRFSRGAERSAFTASRKAVNGRSRTLNNARARGRGWRGAVASSYAPTRSEGRSVLKRTSGPKSELARRRDATGLRGARTAVRYALRYAQRGYRGTATGELCGAVRSAVRAAAGVRRGTVGGTGTPAGAARAWASAEFVWLSGWGYSLSLYEKYDGFS